MNASGFVLDDYRHRIDLHDLFIIDMLSQIIG
jgi:hypothetical protein